MIALTILYEDFTGNYLSEGKVSPMEVMKWAETVARTGEL